MDSTTPVNRGLLQALIGDGRPLLIFTGLSLVLSGGFALFLSATQHFLPHDIQYLGMSAEQLCAVQDCRVVYFMFHDRVSFGGALIAIGSLYMWLAEFPLRNREMWAWWLLVLSGIAGFGSFGAYLGYGYLDTWHGVATFLLLPVFIGGMIKSFDRKAAGPRSLIKPGMHVRWTSRAGIGRALLLATAAGMIAGGLTIMIVGMTSVLVPHDVRYMGIDAVGLKTINPFLLPLIAHDRAGFGGAIATIGIVVLFTVWCAKASKSLWQILCFAGTVGFGSAIGVHLVVGYLDLIHLAPALVGAILFAAGIILCRAPMMEAGRS